MTQADDRLRALFAAEQPPARDPAFCADTMARVARRRFQQDLALLGLTGLVAATILWAVWPVIAPALRVLSQGLVPAMGALGLAGCGLLMLEILRLPGLPPET